MLEGPGAWIAARDHRDMVTESGRSPGRQPCFSTSVSASQTVDAPVVMLAAGLAP
jgi:hypothetical protein